MTAAVLGLLRRMLGFARGEGVERQFGAIPYRRGAHGLEFLLITSRRTGRWIFPKGGRIGWLSPVACAAQEAYEEAGVEGVVAAEPVGSYRGTKQRPEGESEIEVALYPLEVEVELDDWPERGQRRRRWAGLEETCELVSDPGLDALVRALAARLCEKAPPGPAP
ncbi:MAG TPA: NUDIX hydrolase [Thermohalobaculum sp.]|nr:NUDIX hydrolase [Thermohalobaculum sp.]